MDSAIKKKSSLLSKPIEALKLELASEIINKCKENSKKIVDEANQDDGPFDALKSLKCAEQELWVEKFKPRDFFDLLSDDGINRHLLTWMKSWDHCVFGKEIKKEPKTNGPKPSANSNDVEMKDESNPMRNNKNNNFSAKKRKRDFNQNEAELEEKLIELDEQNRPKTKIALLSGPPGLGKTTLAQIIAKRAGYNSIEMNASDDRSVDAFKQNIESVTQLRGSVNDTSMKPSCLIIDEIDGAPANSIQILIDFATGNVKSKKKGGAKDSGVSRPIICICNDLYAQSLKQLRQVAIVFQCPKILTHRLAERLNSICSMTGMHADMDGLIALCDKTNNDIRSCLNTLQFVSKQNQRITAKMVGQLNVGQKDYEKNLFSVMNDIFFMDSSAKKIAGQAPSSTSRYNSATLAGSEESTNRFGHILQSCQSIDSDKLTEALYENYLTLKFRDNNFETVIKANDWFMFNDKIQKHIRDNQDFTLYSYQRYLPIYFHLALSNSSTQTKRFKYPTTFSENYMKKKKNVTVLTHLLDDMTPSLRVMYNSANFITLDLLPFLTDILQPSLRAVSIQLFSKSEKEKIDKLISLMIAFNLNYRQERGFDGQYSYLLEPAIDEVIKYTGLKQKKQLPYVLKQQVAREVAMEKVRIADRHKSQTVTENGDSAKNSANQLSNFFNKNNANNNLSSPVTKNNLMKMNPSLTPSQLSHVTGGERPGSPKMYASPLALKAAAMFKKINKQTDKDDRENKDSNLGGMKNDGKRSKEIPMNDMFKKFLLRPTTNLNKENVDSNKTSANLEAGSVAKESSMDMESPMPPNAVWLKYKEGFINAVRYPVKIRQLM